MDQPAALRMADDLDRRGLTEEAAEMRRLYELNVDKTEIISSLGIQMHLLYERLDAAHRRSYC